MTRFQDRDWLWVMGRRSYSEEEDAIVTSIRIESKGRVGSHKRIAESCRAIGEQLCRTPASVQGRLITLAKRDERNER